MYYGHMSIFGGFGMIFFWILFIAFIIWLVSQSKISDNSKKESPKKILDRRLASGEITEKEYEILTSKIKKNS